MRSWSDIFMRTGWISTRWFIFSAVVVFLLTAGILYNNSLAAIRFSKATVLLGRDRPVQAVALLKKILRKDSVKESIGSRFRALTHFRLGGAYSLLNLEDLAILHLAAGHKEQTVGEDRIVGFPDDSQQARIHFLAMLEAGIYVEAIRWAQQKRDEGVWPDADKYLAVGRQLQVGAGDFKNPHFYYQIGQAYIQGGLYQEANNFFSRRILKYGFTPVGVLEYIYDRYGSNLEIKKKVWGEQFYVTLEDFEDVETKMTHWTGNVDWQASAHNMSAHTVCKGRYAEHLQLNYDNVTGAYDYWIKPVDILISETRLPLGIRSWFGSRGRLRLNLSYPEQNTTGVWSEDQSAEAGNGCKVHSIGNFEQKVQDVRRQTGWPLIRYKIDKIIFDTQGGKGDFYIDDIELFIE